MLRFLILILILFGGVPRAQAADPGTPQYVHINLYASALSVAPGVPFDIYIEELIEPEWHTYWKNPGDSGLALTAKWDVPEGTKVTDLKFPVPKRIEVSPLLNFGYDTRAIHAVTVTPPASIAEDMFRVGVNLDWLVCKDICLPEGGHYNIDLPVREGPPQLNPNIADVLRDVTLTGPLAADWGAQLDEQGGQAIITFTPGPASKRLIDDGAKVEFYPEPWGLIQNPAEQILVHTDSDSLMMTIERGTRALADVGNFTGLFVIEDGEGSRQGYQIPVKIPSVLPVEKPVTLDVSPEKEMEVATVPVPAVLPPGPTLVGVLFLAFLGGLILNLMPCVFPVLSLKLLSLASLSGAEQRLMRQHGLMYALGVMGTFVFIGGILVGFQHVGSAVGWGFHLQNPAVVASLILLFVLLGLNLLGWFQVDFNAWIPARLQRVDDAHAVISSFLTGVLATIVATPCTAPFMGAAVGFALTQSSLIALAVFGALGAGLALPFVLITLIPILGRRLPKPGPWMVSLREALSFPMFLTAVWLLWVLAQETGATGVGLAGLLVVVVVMLMWTFRRHPTSLLGKGARSLFLVIFALAALWTVVFQEEKIRAVVTPTIEAQTFSDEALRKALAGPQPIFVNMTAAWCITCKVNERVALSTPATETLFRKENVLYLKGDWTNYDAGITRYLESHGRRGVPLYVVYPAPDPAGVRPAAIVLPQLLTEGLVAEALRK